MQQEVETELADIKAELLKTRGHLAYAYDVTEGVIPANKLVTAACNRAIDEHTADLTTGSYRNWKYIGKLAELFLAFIPNIRHLRGALHGQPLQLQPWQRFFYAEIYGWRHAETYCLRFVSQILIVGKKNGKSMMGAARVLYELLHADDDNVEIFLVAPKSEQAKTLWTTIEKLVRRLPPELSGEFSIKGQEIIGPKGFCTYLATGNAAASARNDGINPYLTIVDEAGLVDRTIMETLQLSQMSRVNYSTMMLTHPYQSQDSALYEEYQSCKKGLTGEIPIDSIERTLGMFYGLDDEKEIDDEEKWILANPGLGQSPLVENLRESVKQAKVSPAKMNSLLVKNMGVWRSESDAIFSRELLERNFCTTLHTEIAKLPKVIIGLDLSSAQDLTAVALLHQTASTWYFSIQYWTTREFFQNVSDDLRWQYDNARDSGILNVQDQSSINLGEVEAFIDDIARQWEVTMIGADPHRATLLLNNLIESGFTVTRIFQTPARLCDARNEMLARFRNGTLQYDGNDFTTWQLLNLHGEERHNVHYWGKPDKLERHRKIDGAAALTSALACGILAPEPEYNPRLSFIVLPK